MSTSSVNPRSYDAVPPQKVAFLGLGVMGFPMAGHLARAGHQVTVYNRSAPKAQAWVAEFGGSAAAKPCRALTSCSAAWATTTTCAQWCWASTAPWPA